MSEGIGSVRFCGFATFTGLNAANITVVVTIGTQPGTAGKSYCIKLNVTFGLRGVRRHKIYEVGSVSR